MECSYFLDGRFTIFLEFTILGAILSTNEMLYIVHPNLIPFILPGLGKNESE